MKNSAATPPAKKRSIFPPKPNKAKGHFEAMRVAPTRTIAERVAQVLARVKRSDFNRALPGR
jgi:hypothetical protein